MKILISTPFLKNIGGTEIETLLTIKAIQENNLFKEVVLFCPFDINLSLFNLFDLSQKVKVLKYPGFFRNRYFRRIDKELRKLLRWKTSPSETLFWLLQRTEDFNLLYILSSSSNNYFIPILKGWSKQRTLIKYTTVYDENIPGWKKEYLKTVQFNIVMSKSHETILRKQKISNIIVQDVLIGNEGGLLKCQSSKKHTFGIFCRLSPEKGIEDSISLIKYLRERNYNVSLLIEGYGKKTYSTHLKSLVKKYNLQEDIRLINKKVLPHEAIEFYKKISFFLITSKFEGGPMTGLEAMAAGIPVLSYNVGAMPDRLEKYPSLLAENLEELKSKAETLLTLNDDQYQEISNEIRSHYCRNLSNESKTQRLAALSKI